MLHCGLNHALDVSNQIGASQINRIHKKIARKAGLNESAIEGISGHPVRVGAAQDLLNSGTSMPMIMQCGRWSRTYTVMRYPEQIRWQGLKNCSYILSPTVDLPIKCKLCEFELTCLKIRE